VVDFLGLNQHEGRHDEARRKPQVAPRHVPSSDPDEDRDWCVGRSFNFVKAEAPASVRVLLRGVVLDADDKLDARWKSRDLRRAEAKRARLNQNEV
jgi:hypothetical protein